MEITKQKYEDLYKNILRAGLLQQLVREHADNIVKILENELLSDIIIDMLVYNPDAKLDKEEVDSLFLKNDIKVNWVSPEESNISSIDFQKEVKKSAKKTKQITNAN